MAMFPTLEEASAYLLEAHGITVSPAKLEVHRPIEAERYLKVREHAQAHIERRVSSHMARALLRRSRLGELGDVVADRPMGVVNFPLEVRLSHGGNLPRGYRLLMADEKKRKADERDELDLDPEVALREPPEVDPDEPVPQDEPAKKQGDELAE
jgi:hypothetical protein